MKLYFIAGEQSGDYIGSKIIQSLKKQCQDSATKLDLVGIGGERMIAEGVESLFPIEHISLMGFVEVLPHIFKIKKLIDDTVADIAYHKPDILITIDSPGFTKRVAKEVKKHVPDVRLLHVVAPSVWAYKPGRAKKYAEIYDHLLTLLPFEPEYFIKEGLDSMHIGHPILEQNFYSFSNGLKDEMSLPIDSRVVVITPGSRKGEISRHMKAIVGSLERLNQTHKITALFVQSNENNISLISSYLAKASFNYSFTTDRLKAFAVADVALAKSGTNTLEIAASGTPQVVGYRLNPISYLIVKAMIKIKFACLINIIAGKEIIPEYIQSDFTVDNLSMALSDLLGDKKKSASQVKSARDALRQMGFDSDNADAQKPSDKAAQKIIQLCSKVEDFIQK